MSLGSSPLWTPPLHCSLGLRVGRFSNSKMVLLTRVSGSRPALHIVRIAEFMFGQGANPASGVEVVSGGEDGSIDAGTPRLVSQG